MATLLNSINHFVTGSVKAAADVFTSIFFMLDEYGQEIGVRRVAYNTGSYPQGKGMGYSFSLNSSSNNAWACFYWSRASTPFFMLMQYATSSTNSFPFGDDLTHAQGILRGNTSSVSQGGVGIQFAAVPFSLGRNVDIWEGSRASNGDDRKNFPCPWSTGTNDLVVFPRANNGLVEGRHDGQIIESWASGLSPLSKSAYSCLISQNDIASRSLMWHLLADADTFMFLKNFGTSTLSYNAMYFGKYEEAVGYNSKMKYVMINHLTGVVDDPPFSPLSSGTFYGDRQSTSSFDGGIAYPSCFSGCFAACLDIPSFISSSRFTPARLFASASNYPLYDEFPWGVGAYDPEGQVFGFGGSIRFMRMLWGVNTHTVFSESMRAAFGNGVTGSIKFTVPWMTGSLFTPGTHLHRTGTQIIFETTY